jgi:hypothetical protein
MEWKIIFHTDPQYVEVITAGIADKDDSLNMAKALTEAMRSNQINRALIDHRNIDSFVGEITEVYERPKIMKLLGIIFKIRIAEIIKINHIEHFKFLETVFINQGFSFQIFQEKDKAVKWLLE